MNRNYAMFMAVGFIIGGLASFVYFKNREEEVVEKEEETVELYDREGNVTKARCGEVVGMNQYKTLARDYCRPVRPDMGIHRSEGPYEISFEDFCEGNDKQDKVTLSYYTDDVLIEDPDDVMVDDRISMLGTDTLDMFGHLSGDPSIVYVRNEKLGIDFEVVKLDTPYSEGMEE